MLKRLQGNNKFEFYSQASDAYTNGSVSIEKGVQSLCQDLESISKQTMTRGEAFKFNLLYANLMSIKQSIPTLADSIKATVRTVEALFAEKVALLKKQADSLLAKAKEDKKVIIQEPLAEFLSQLVALSSSIQIAREKAEPAIDALLSSYGKIYAEDLQSIQDLSNALEETTDGSDITQKHPLFETCRNAARRAKTATQDIQYVLKHLKGDGLDLRELEDKYHEFDRKYQTELARALKQGKGAQTSLIANIKLLAGTMSKSVVVSALDEEKQEDSRSSKVHIAWSSNTRFYTLDLMMLLSVLWTLQRSKEAIAQNMGGSWLAQPHPAQVVAIFRIMGIGYLEDMASDNLENSLHQILTGEGKSLVLGMASAMFALLGFEAYCACYSAYLSNRDHEAFRPFFDSLDISGFVHYGTFNQLCESVLNEHGPLRDQVTGLISGAKVRPHSLNGRPKILLIDEVDVFFNKDFYGNLYTPSTHWSDPAITALVDYIWKNRGQELQLKSIRGLQVYQDCLARFRGWEDLLNEAIKDMLVDLKDFDAPTHEYLVDHDRICYKEQDGISDKIVCRYKTMFAYYYEYEQGNITVASLKEHIQLILACGSYSYAELAHHFDRVTGVTGTLEDLSKAQHEVVKKEYQIQRKTYLPSAYGQCRRDFAPDGDTSIVSEEDYFLAITNAVELKLLGGKRSVLVFFETKKELLSFWHSAVFSTYQAKALKMTQEVSDKEKESIVRAATRAGQITLLTREFGRGTDFITGDKMVLANCGVHVIQTFLSEDKSEEIQIRGRTARQGQPGSYQMVLKRQALELYFSEDLEAVMDEMGGDGKRYDRLDTARNEAFARSYESDKGGVQATHEEHLSSMNFLAHLRQNDVVFVKKMLIELNKASTQGAGISRTICLMDATGSMSSLLQAAKNTVTTMYTQVSAVLEQETGKGEGFEMQFAVYRNYSSDEDTILQVSEWESKAIHLRSFMQTVNAAGGCWPGEAVEIGLWHVNRELEHGLVTQVILIGDAPPNTLEEVKKHRKDYKGEKYWLKTKFGESINAEQQLQLLREKDVPIHAYYVTGYAEPSFRHIAQSNESKPGNKRSNCEFLDVNSPEGAKLLTQQVSEQVLKDVAGEKNAEQYVRTYRRMFSA